MSYGKLNSEDVVLSSEIVSVPIWSNGSDTISHFASGSSQSSASKEYYTDIYISGSSAASDPVQFSIAYANGTAATGSAARTVYGQFRSLVLGDESSTFEFGSTFWALTIDRARYKECLVPGSFELVLSGSTIKESSNDPVMYKDCGRAAKIYASGTLRGYILYDIGTILVTDAATTPAVFLQNLGSIKVQSQETVSSNFVFVRAKNSEFNYSMNPTFVNSNGELNNNLAANNPETFITSVGLYNDANELLAIAKLSRPLAKNFTKEALIRVKLDY